MDTINIGNERVYTVEGRDAQNNPQPLLPGDVPEWTVAPEGVVTLLPTSDGLSCEVPAVVAGTCTVTVKGKNTKGDMITGTASIQVSGATEVPVATRLELTAGPEIPV